MPLDPIAAVEAAYRVDRTPEAWVAGALEAVAPALRGDVACCAVPYRVVDDRIVPSPPTVVPDTPAIRDAAAHILDANARDVVEKVIRRPWAFSSMSERFPEEDPMAAHVVELSAPLRARDSMSLVVRDHPTDGVIFASLASRPQRTDASERARMARVAAHLAAGHRLVGAFDGTDGALVEAVLDPDGRLRHAAREAARSRAAREGLRARVRDIERARGRMRREDPDGALELWQGLVRGTWSLVDHFDRDGRRFVLAVRNASGYLDPRALTPRERHVANLVAGGATNAEIAYALGLREQTVARVASRVFRKLHLTHRADLVRLLSPRGTSAATASVVHARCARSLTARAR